MAERQTLLSRSISAPTVQPTQTGAPQGAFGDYRGVEALGHGIANAGNVGVDLATRRQREFEDQKIQDVRIKFAVRVQALAQGIDQEHQKYQEAYSSKPYETTAGILNKAKSDFRKQHSRPKVDSVV